LKEVGLKLWDVICENGLAVMLLEGGFLKACVFVDVLESDVDMRALQIGGIRKLATTTTAFICVEWKK